MHYGSKQKKRPKSMKKGCDAMDVNKTPKVVKEVQEKIVPMK